MVAVALILLFVTLSALYVYFAWHNGYWKRRGIPGPPSQLFYGNKSVFSMTKPVQLQIWEWTKKYGKIYGYKEGVRNHLVISDMEMIKEVFLKQFDNFHARRVLALHKDLVNDERVNLLESRGQRWKRLRATSSPNFTMASLRKVFDLIHQSAIDTIQALEAHDGGDAFNIHDYHAEFTLEAISRMVLGQKESKLFNNPLHSPIKATMHSDMDVLITHTATAFPVLSTTLFWNALKLNISYIGHMKKLTEKIEDEVRRRVEQRKREGPPEVARDFIDLFLDASTNDDIDNNDGAFRADQAVAKVNTLDEVIAQGMLFVSAGYETTSSTLAFISWMLSKHPEAMQKCQEEVDDRCRNESISFDDCVSLPYLEATIKETVRFYPVAAKGLARTCMHDTIVGDMKIEKGTCVTADTYFVHFDKTVWGPDAEEFRPDRWLEDTRPTHPVAYMGFGLGPRLCVGMRLAMLEMKLMMAYLLRKYDLLDEGTNYELELNSFVTMWPTKTPVKIRSRADVL